MTIARTLRDSDLEWTVLYDALLVERHRGDVVKYTRLGIMTFWPPKDPDYVEQIEDPERISEVLLV